MKQQRQTFEQHMEQLARRHGVHSVFSDFLTLLMCAFSLGQREEEYLKTIRKYEKPEAYKISEALAALTVEMTGDGTGMVDVLGDYFEQHLSYGRNGQFFTPQHLCDMMARLMNPTTPLERILDPACGSGRMLMAMAKVNRFATFYGADNDRNCACMCAINMCLNGMYGEVAWMNSITNQFYAAWQIHPTVKGCPCITQISEKQSYIHMKLPENKTDIPKIKIPVLENKPREIPVQQLLFEF
ncbi:MAG: SAM-dependent DNA methyltransferase [Draconibacterium sp.]|nr:SAM-dependent DNA methyltransferase [Draconibacterium sp.]